MTTSVKGTLAADASEMFNALKKLDCFKRHFDISHGTLSEIIVAHVTNGRVLGGNKKGRDVESQRYGMIEVKSRMLGSDGPNPRVSLRPGNLANSDYFAALRWSREFDLTEAILLPKYAVLPVYNA
ncbi:MAG: hypothetical protein ACU0A9_04380, partial [Alterinioella nitratireducens]|uniref:hypothetical protein n=1 Tax=Alterinioella nitratireducens TaxID=2735915 RepID=UPI004058E344